MKIIMRTYLCFVVSVLGALLVAPTFALAYYAAPVSVTDMPTFITENSAQLNGKVNANEMPDTTQWFEWGVVGRAETVYETPHRGAWAGNTLAAVSASLTGLAPNMQYFYRQVSENGRGKNIGMTTYFTTKPLPIVVTPIVIVETNAPTAITEVSADIKGYFSPHGNTAAQWWFEWGHTSQMENRTPVSRSWYANSGPVSVTLTGLTPGMTYFYRIVGENDLGQVYGATRVFVTHGKLPVVSSETPRNQAIQNPSSGDNVTRTVTTNGQQTTSGSVGSTGFPGANALDIIGGLFGRKPATASTSNVPTNTASSQTQSSTSANTTQNAVQSSANQVASTGASTPVGTFWNTLTGKKSVEVNIEKVGPKSVPAHTAIEYRVTYAYRLDAVVTGAKLKVILPENVIYIGDNTENELLLEESAGPERTYVLPVGRLENGSTRTISILGMTTGAANGTFPDARARMEYVNAGNVLQVVAAGSGVASDAETSLAETPMSFIPSSLFGWLLFTLLIVGAIISLRKAKAYYLKRKEEIAQEEAEAVRARSGAQPSEVIA